MGGACNYASDDEIKRVFDEMMATQAAKSKRIELSEKSFKEWLYSVLRTYFARIGYKLKSFEEFWRDIGISIKSGFREGQEAAKKEAEIRRKLRENKRK
ncbi:MAG: hypothetical protein IKZ82_10105 [Clostridia bacterium]|nr:hypothetical protein [Clostridia bacterium]